MSELAPHPHSEQIASAPELQELTGRSLDSLANLSPQQRTDHKKDQDWYRPSASDQNGTTGTGIGSSSGVTREDDEDEWMQAEIDDALEAESITKRTAFRGRVAAGTTFRPLLQSHQAALESTGSRFSPYPRLPVLASRTGIPDKRQGKTFELDRGTNTAVTGSGGRDIASPHSGPQHSVDIEMATEDEPIHLDDDNKKDTPTFEGGGPVQFFRKPKDLYKYRSWRAVPGFNQAQGPHIDHDIRQMCTKFLKIGKSWKEQEPDAIEAFIRGMKETWSDEFDRYEDAWPLRSITCERLSAIKGRMDRTTQPETASKRYNGSKKRSALKPRSVSSSTFKAAARSLASATSVTQVVGDKVAVSLMAAGVITIEDLAKMADWSQEGTRAFLQNDAQLTPFGVAHTVQMLARWKADVMHKC